MSAKTSTPAKSASSEKTSGPMPIDKGIRLNVQISHEDMELFKKAAALATSGDGKTKGMPVTSWVRIMLRQAARS
jgi:hypothetical protein